MRWLDEQEWKALHPDKDLSDEALSSCVSSAIRKVEVLTDSTTLADLVTYLAEDPFTEAAATETIIEDLREAQEYFALAKSIDYELKMVEQERDENDSVVNKYRVIKDALALQSSYETKARQVLAAYAPSTTSSYAGMGTISIGTSYDVW